MQKEIFRIIDANFNRSREGLRVCEEIARFILSSPSLTKDFKAVRHSISNIIKSISIGSKRLLASRDVEGDVGKNSRFKTEMKRRDAVDIFYANMERVKESLRVLEEFLKLIDKKASSKFVVLRFKIYDIEKRSVKKVASLCSRG